MSKLTSADTAGVSATGVKISQTHIHICTGGGVGGATIPQHPHTPSHYPPLACISNLYLFPLLQPLLASIPFPTLSLPFLPPHSTLPSLLLPLSLPLTCYIQPSCHSRSPHVLRQHRTLEFPGTVERYTLLCLQTPLHQVLQWGKKKAINQQ